jgi:hypothetical protein
MSRKNGQKYRNFMAFRQKNLERQNGKSEAGDVLITDPQESLDGFYVSGTPINQIFLHKVLATQHCSEFLEYARENFAKSGRGAVAMKTSDLMVYNPDAPAVFDAKVCYMNPKDIELLPATAASLIATLIMSYDVEQTFVFVVGSKDGLSAYTFGRPCMESDDEAIDAEGGQP